MDPGLFFFSHIKFVISKGLYILYAKISVKQNVLLLKKLVSIY